ncbi:unnamed protein product [Discosporangium mesarthrocarpum]
MDPQESPPPHHQSSQHFQSPVCSPHISPRPMGSLYRQEGVGGRESSGRGEGRQAAGERLNAVAGTGARAGECKEAGAGAGARAGAGAGEGHTGCRIARTSHSRQEIATMELGENSSVYTREEAMEEEGGGDDVMRAVWAELNHVIRDGTNCAGLMRDCTGEALGPVVEGNCQGIKDAGVCDEGCGLEFVYSGDDKSADLTDVDREFTSPFPDLWPGGEERDPGDPIIPVPAGKDSQPLLVTSGFSRTFDTSITGSIEKPTLMTAH